MRAFSSTRKLAGAALGSEDCCAAPDELLAQVGAQISARYGVADDMLLLVVFGFLANANLEWEGYMFDGRGRCIALHGSQRIRGA